MSDDAAARTASSSRKLSTVSVADRSQREQALTRLFNQFKEGLGVTKEGLGSLTTTFDLLDRKLTAAEVGLIYDRVKVGKKPELNFGRFQEAVRCIAVAKETPFTELMLMINSADTSLFATLEWEFSDDEEDALIIRVDTDEWQIGFGGEEAPRERCPIQWAGKALDPVQAAGLVTTFFEAHCNGQLPQNVVFVLPAPCFGTFAQWERFAFHTIGFEGMVTTDTRHMMFYCSGKRTGICIDVTADHVTSLAQWDGFAMDGSTMDLEIPALSKVPGSEATQLAELVSQCVLKSLAGSPIDTRRQLLGNVTLAGPALVGWCGANAVTTGGLSAMKAAAVVTRQREVIVGEITRRLQAALPASARADLKVVWPPEFKYAAWIGGSQLAGLSATQVGWLHREHERNNSEMHDIDDADDLEDMELLFRHLFGRRDEKQGYWEIMRGRYHAGEAEGGSSDAALPAHSRSQAAVEITRHQLLQNAKAKAKTGAHPRPAADFKSAPSAAGQLWLPAWGAPGLPASDYVSPSHSRIMASAAAAADKADKLAKQEAAATTRARAPSGGGSRGGFFKRAGSHKKAVAANIKVGLTAAPSETCLDVCGAHSQPLAATRRHSQALAGTHTSLYCPRTNPGRWFCWTTTSSAARTPTGRRRARPRATGPSVAQRAWRSAASPSST